jgi:Lon protease-like protein
MAPSRPERIPLVPLNVVLLPGAALPLHIFEPRYRHMVKNCLEEKSEFGVLLALPNGVVRVGCTAEITAVVKRYEDGRSDIQTLGRAPFRVVELFAEGPLAEGQVEYLEDEDAPSDPALEHNLSKLYEACYTLVFGDYPRDADERKTASLSYHVAASLPMDLMWKQQMLELRSEPERQRRLVKFLVDWAPHLKKTVHLRGRAGGNGHGLN